MLVGASHVAFRNRQGTSLRGLSDVERVQQLMIYATRERRSNAPICDHLLNAPQSSRKHTRILALYCKQHVSWISLVLQRLSAGLVNNTLHALRSDAAILS